MEDEEEGRKGGPMVRAPMRAIYGSHWEVLMKGEVWKDLCEGLWWGASCGGLPEGLRLGLVEGPRKRGGQTLKYLFCVCSLFRVKIFHLCFVHVIKIGLN